MRGRRGRIAVALLVGGFCVGLWGCAAKVQAPPEPPGTVRKAEEAFRLRDYERAVELYRTYADLVRRDPYVPRVLYKAALAQFQLGRYEDALATLRELQDRYPNRRWVQVEALRGDVEAALQHPLAAIHAWDSAFAVARPPDESKLRLRVATVAAKLSEQDLRDAAATATAKPVQEILLAQLAQREQPEIPEPLPEFAGAESEGEALPELGADAELAAAEPVEPEAVPEPEEIAGHEVLPKDFRVGALVSAGDKADWVEAVQMVLGDEAVVEQQAQPGELKASWETLLADPRVAVVFVDDIGGHDAELAREARRRAVPVVDLAARVEGGPQPYWIRAGLGRGTALAVLLDYAVNRARLRRFGIVYPDTLDGHQFFRQAQEELARRGAVVVGADAYAPDAKSLTAGLVRRWRERENLQALLLSDTVTAAATFARFLQAEMPDIPLLGVEDWSALGQMVPQVSGVWFVAPALWKGPEGQHWAAEFESRTGRRPSARAALAYEAALWIKELISRGGGEEPLTRQRLWQAMAEPGVVRSPLGEVELREQRFARSPVVVQFTRGELEVVPAPAAGEEAAEEQTQISAAP